MKCAFAVIGSSIGGVLAGAGAGSGIGMYLAPTAAVSVGAFNFVLLCGAIGAVGAGALGAVTVCFDG
jgi:hypothetical protein